MKRKEITSLLIGACILGSIVGAVPTVANAATNTAIVKDKVAIKNNSGKIVGYTNPYDGIDVKDSNKDLCNVTTQFGLKGNVEKKDLQFINSDLNEQFESMNEDGHVVNVTTGLNLREKASTDSNIIGNLDNNTNLKIVGKQGDWYKVSINGKEGFVYSSFIDEGKSTDNKSSDEKVAPRQDLNDYYEDMKDTGKWNHVYNSGFTIGVSGFTVNSNEIKFLTDGSFTSSEEDKILKVFEKITPSAVGQIKDALDNGKDFSGTFDGLHISASFDKFGQITITNDADADVDSDSNTKENKDINTENTQVDTNKDNKQEEKQETKDTSKEDTQNTRVDTNKDVKDNTEVNNKDVDTKPEEKQDVKDNSKEASQTDKVDANKDSKVNDKLEDTQNTDAQDKQNVKEDSNEKQADKQVQANNQSNQQVNEDNSLDSKKTVQADDKLDNNDAKQDVKTDDTQNTQQNTQIDNSKLLANNSSVEAQTK